LPHQWGKKTFEVEIKAQGRKCTPCFSLLLHLWRVNTCPPPPRRWTTNFGCWGEEEAEKRANQLLVHMAVNFKNLLCAPRQHVAQGYLNENSASTKSDI